MGELIQFPVLGKAIKKSVEGQTDETIAYFDDEWADVGSSIIVVIAGRKYVGKILNISRRDQHGNVLKVEYGIPTLSGDDPLKYGEAKFKYGGNK